MLFVSLKNGSKQYAALLYLLRECTFDYEWCVNGLARNVEQIDAFELR